MTEWKIYEDLFGIRRAEKRSQAMIVHHIIYIDKIINLQKSGQKAYSPSLLVDSFHRYCERRVAILDI